MGRRCCLLIKCKCKADSTQPDLPNFWVCSLGGAWRGTSTLRRSFLSTGSVLLAERTQGQVTWGLRPGKDSTSTTEAGPKDTPKREGVFWRRRGLAAGGVG